SDKTVTLWDFADRSDPHRLGATTSHIYLGAVAFSPDGQLLATEGGGVVMLWSVANQHDPALLATLTHRDMRANSVAFSPDGRTLAAGGSGRSHVGTVISLWDYSELNDLLAHPAQFACAVTGRSLTKGEWARYVPEVTYQKGCTG
ncbi:MAG TPA: hypothetical protein VFO77_06045, partial [Actinoplanes sp.]|nr:hypothetical protein [Actinoplanes sp.]